MNITLPSYNEVAQRRSDRVTAIINQASNNIVVFLAKRLAEMPIDAKTHQSIYFTDDDVESLRLVEANTVLLAEIVQRVNSAFEQSGWKSNQKDFKLVYDGGRSTYPYQGCFSVKFAT